MKIFALAGFGLLVVGGLSIGCNQSSPPGTASPSSVRAPATTSSAVTTAPLGSAAQTTLLTPPQTTSSASSRPAPAAGATATPATGGTTGLAGTAPTPSAPAPPATTAALSLSLGAANPAPVTVKPGASRVSVLQARITGTGGTSIVSGLTIGTTGTSNASSDVTIVELAFDQNHNGVFDPGVDTIIGASSFVSGAGVAPFVHGAMAPLTVPANAQGDILVLLTFAPTATAGATIGVTLDGANVMASDASTQAPIAVSGMLASSTFAIAVATTALPPTPSPPLSSPSSWATRSPMPTPRMKMTATTTDSGKIYVIGGRTVAGSLPTNEEYDPTTDAWTRRAPMPTARIQHGAAAIGSKVYVVGGSSDGTDVLATAEVYDASTDSWRTLPSLPTARRDVVVVAFGGLIWAIDGFDGTGAYLAADVFDPQAGTWRTTVSVGFDGSLGTIAGGDILLIEQNQVDWGPGAAAATNPYAATFAATSSAAFDFAPGSAVASIGDLAYLVGGSRNGLAVAECKTVDGTRIQSGGAVVAKASLGTARRNLAAAAGLNGKIYAFGGYAGGSQALDTVEVLTP